MGALTSTSPASSSFSLNPPTEGQAQPLTQLSQPGGQPNSVLMNGLTNYFKGQTAAAGNPNATSPSMGSSLAQSFGSAFDNSQMGGLINSAAGNAVGNGYGAQGSALMSGADAGGGAAGDAAVSGGADAAGADAAGGAAAGGGASDGAAAAISIVCTAFYSQKMLPRNIWVCTQRYGRSVSADTFAGYLFWASPIARRIGTSPRFARLAAMVLMPVGYEMAIVMKEPNIKSTLRGRLALGVGCALSFMVGKILRLRRAFHGVSAKA